MQLGVDRHRVPDVTPAAVDPVFRSRVPSLGGHCLGCVLERLGRVPGRDEPTPFHFARLRVISRHVAAYAILAAAVTDKDLVVHDVGRGGNGDIFCRVRIRVPIPDHRAGVRIERDQVRIQCADVDLALVDGDPAIDDVATGRSADASRSLRVEGPKSLPSARVDGMHDRPRSGHIHHSVHDNRSGFNTASRFQIISPREPEPGHTGIVDLMQTTKPGRSVIEAIAGPLRACCRIGNDHRIVNRGCALSARCDTRYEGDARQSAG